MVYINTLTIQKVLA